MTREEILNSIRALYSEQREHAMMVYEKKKNNDLYTIWNIVSEVYNIYVVHKNVDYLDEFDELYLAMDCVHSCIRSGR